jgi:hypothetical protein
MSHPTHFFYYYLCSQGKHNSICRFRHQFFLNWPLAAHFFYIYLCSQGKHNSICPILPQLASGGSFFFIIIYVHKENIIPFVASATNPSSIGLWRLIFFYYYLCSQGKHNSICLFFLSWPLAARFYMENIMYVHKENILPIVFMYDIYYPSLNACASCLCLNVYNLD